MAHDRKTVSCVATVPIFRNLGPEELDEVIMIAHYRKLDRGQFIFASGDTVASLYVIHQGKIKITRYSEDGKEQVIRILSHGDFLGELALFNDARATTYAEALEPTVVCMIDNKGMKELMAKSPALSFKMMGELSNRLEKAEALIEHNNLYSAEAKVARLLLEISREALVRFHTTKANMASNLGITPETFSRKLRQLENEGLIHIIDNKSLTIKDKEGLELIVNPDKL